MNTFLKHAALWVRDIRHLPKTLYFNFRYFPIETAIKLPVMVSTNVRLLRTGGRVELAGPIRPRMVRIGFGNVGIFDRKSSKSVWEVSGIVCFDGSADIGHGSKISVRGRLTLGDNFGITAESQIVCWDSITFGRDCLLSWQVLVMDTDFHTIYNDSGHQINADRPIRIGNKNWIGCRTLILKGATTADNCVIAAGSTVTRSTDRGDVILGGAPVEVLRANIQWQR